MGKSMKRYLYAAFFVLGWFLMLLQGQEAIHIDCTQVLKDLDGAPLPWTPPNGKLPTVATFGAVAKDALVNGIPGDDKAEGSAKYDNWILAGKIYPDKHDAILTMAELTTIKDRIGRAYPGGTVVGPAWQMIADAISHAPKPTEKSKP
jgi:hypothetical protein